LQFHQSSFIKYVIGVLLLLFAIAILIKSDTKSLIVANKLSILDVVVSFTMALLVFFVSGWKLANLVKLHTGVNIERADYLFLPIEMNFWGYIIPIKGGLLYSILFLDKKYSVSYKDTFSITLFIYLVTIVLSGIFGFLYLFKIDSYLSFYGFLFTLCIFSPGIILIFNMLFPIVCQSKSTVSKWFYSFINDIINPINSLIHNPQAAAIVILQTSLHIILLGAWIYLSSLMFEIHMQLLSALIIACALQLSLIIRIIPGNLGGNELIIAGIFVALGGQADQGVLIALLLRGVTLFLTFTMGLYLSWKNFNLFNVEDFSSLWKKIKS
jgi:uncharacterized membrane protein YbhN (UPF0104 family)